MLNDYSSIISSLKSKIFFLLLLILLLLLLVLKVVVKNDKLFNPLPQESKKKKETAKRPSTPSAKEMKASTRN